ncbi:MAG: preprotein translocase subunit YajC [Gemmatimonadota bacterium]
MTHLPIAAMLAPSGQQSGGALFMFLAQIAAFIAIFYFILIRPQRQQAKKHEATLKAMKKGDDIVTSGGIVGEIVHIKENLVTIRSGESKLVVERERIAKVSPKGAGTPAA